MYSVNIINTLRWDGKNADPVMMSMADGGGSAAGPQEDLVCQPNALNSGQAVSGNY